MINIEHNDSSLCVLKDSDFFSQSHASFRLNERMDSFKNHLEELSSLAHVLALQNIFLQSPLCGKKTCLMVPDSEIPNFYSSISKMYDLQKDSIEIFCIGQDSFSFFSQTDFHIAGMISLCQKDFSFSDLHEVNAFIQRSCNDSVYGDILFVSLDGEGEICQDSLFSYVSFQKILKIYECACEISLQENIHVQILDEMKEVSNQFALQIGENLLYGFLLNAQLYAQSSPSLAPGVSTNLVSLVEVPSFQQVFSFSYL